MTTVSKASGIEGLSCRGRGTMPWRTFSSTAKSLSPVKSFSPVSNSQSTTPTAKTSLR